MKEKQNCPEGIYIYIYAYIAKKKREMTLMLEMQADCYEKEVGGYEDHRTTTT